MASSAESEGTPRGRLCWSGKICKDMYSWFRRLIEPRVNTIPNDGLIRYKGLLNSERIMVTSPKALSEVLTTKSYEFIKPTHIRSGLGRILGVGVLLAEGNEHKMQRKALMPAFAFRHVKDLYPVFWDKSKEAINAMTAKLLADASGTPVHNDVEKEPMLPHEAVMEVGDWASRATLDIIGVAGLGKDFGAIKDPETRLCQTYRTILRPSKAARILQLLQFFLPLWFVRRIPIKRNGELEKAVIVIRDTCRDLIRNNKEMTARGEKAKPDILSVAMQSGGFSDENLIDQLMTFLAAGHEVSSILYSVWELILIVHRRRLAV
jgi:cytochrome P450